MGEEEAWERKKKTREKRDIHNSGQKEQKRKSMRVHGVMEVVGREGRCGESRVVCSQLTLSVSFFLSTWLICSADDRLTVVRDNLRNSY